jgi:hypothetical protein
MYNILDFPHRNADEDDWAQGLKDPDLHRAIEESPIIHTIKTAPYLASIIRARPPALCPDTA